ncbi:MAG: alanine--tRNA ligase [Chloroflexi bacterium]|nr:alanine--tRNA ligase [Chloroflexota bacterium]
MFRTSDEIRKSFLEFFAERGHVIVPSSSLIPAGDPTLLFANSGMVQFKDVFLGIEKRPYTRATTSQKCMRVSGKHNDFENVGPSPRHHTFFEMLGNFSLGDYFKKDAIQFAWDLFVNKWGMEPSRLWVTVFQGDDEVPADNEAIELWQKVGIPAERILGFGRKDNFWQMGETGPCGPNSEIHYYRGEHPEDPQFNRREYVNGDGEETIELWNLVFMQFNRYVASEGKYALDPLPRPSVDTGAGLERIAAIMQGKLSNYETDLFTPLIETTRKLLNKPADDYGIPQRGVSYRVIADHARAVTFLIADGVNPTNEGRGYVTRLILRRAARHGQLLGFNEPFLQDVIPTVIAEMGEVYPEIIQYRERILKTAREEEEKFLATLRVGTNLLDDIVSDLKAKGATEIPGDAAFRLYDTYGFPLDLTREVARENNMLVDEQAFRVAMDQAKATSRKFSATGKMDGAAFQAARDTYDALQASGALPAAGVHYNPYAGTKTDTRVVGIVCDGALVDELRAGQGGQLVLADTCFYVESGGQISDTGKIIRPRDASVSFRDPVAWEFRVDDTRQPVPGFILHIGEMVKGNARVNDNAVAEVDATRRMDIMRNHTATHLLHAELRRVLGTHVHQAGSLVAPDRLRFDFTHTHPVSAQDLAEIESGVNTDIFKNDSVEPFVLPKDEAIARGAMALFGEKYGDTVRMMEIVDSTTSNPISQELCGGTHVERTGQIGLFHIVAEGSVASGVRRIEAVTGAAAYAELQKATAQVERLAVQVKTTPERLEQKIASLLAQIETQDKEIQRLRRAMAKRQAENVEALVKQVDGVQVLTHIVDVPNMDLLREQSDYFRDKIGSGIVALGAIINDKPSMIVAVTPDLVEKGFDAQKIVRASAPLMGGGGGGRPALAQAGGKDASKLQEALEQVVTVISNQLSVISNQLSVIGDQ